MLVRERRIIQTIERTMHFFIIVVVPFLLLPSPCAHFRSIIQIYCGYNCFMMVLQGIFPLLKSDSQGIIMLPDRCGVSAV